MPNFCDAMMPELDGFDVLDKFGRIPNSQACRLSFLRQCASLAPAARPSSAVRRNTWSSHTRPKFWYRPRAVY